MSILEFIGLWIVCSVVVGLIIGPMIHYGMEGDGG